MGTVELLTTVAPKTVEGVINSLSNFADEDFNGNNGDEFTSELALEEGFKSDLDFILNRLHKKYEGVEYSDDLVCKIINEYIEYAYSSSYYDNVNWNFEISGRDIFIVLGYVTD